MGDLSRHYSHRDFACRCTECVGKKSVRVHLGLVGVLEELCARYRRRIRVSGGYRCRAMAEKVGSPIKGVHTMGRAVHIALDGVPLPELYGAAAAFPKIKGIGYYPEENTIHIDTREDEVREEWVKEQGRTVPLTPERKMKYGLDLAGPPTPPPPPRNSLPLPTPVPFQKGTKPVDLTPTGVPSVGPSNGATPPSKPSGPPSAEISLS